jgi:nitroreductase
VTSYQDLIQQRFGADPDRQASNAEAEPFFNRLLTRAVSRDFLLDPISAELFELLIASALSASSKSDLQQASIIDIVSEHQRNAVANLTPSMPWVRTAPRSLIFCGDAYRFECIAKLHGSTDDHDSVEDVFNAAVDAALVMQTFILAAEVVGLASCPISQLRQKGADLAVLLSLPQRVFPIAGLAVGYPRKPEPITPPLPRSLTVHRDRYGMSDLAPTVELYDQRRKARAAPSAKNDDQTWSEARCSHFDQRAGRRFHSYLERAGFNFGSGRETVGKD